VTEIDFIIWSGIDGDGVAGRAVNASAFDAGDANRSDDDYAAILARGERLDLAKGTRLVDRKLEAAAGICRRCAIAPIGACA
jgi:hypothetical protein